MQDDKAEPEGLTDLERAALRQMHSNIREGLDRRSGVRYRYVRPSQGRYEWQWFWDSCFHAIVNARLDPELAKDELRSMVALQDPDGFIGHLNFWGPRGVLKSAFSGQSKLGHWRHRHSAMIQPPLLAQAVEAVWEASSDEAFVREIIPSVRRYYDWLQTRRDPGDTGLIATFSPFESGLDNSPGYDGMFGFTRPGRGGWLLATHVLDVKNMLLGRNFDSPAMLRDDRFVFYDLLVNSGYADGLRTLGRLLDAIGEDSSAAMFQTRAERADVAINEQCWDSERGIWAQLAGVRRATVPTLTIAVLYPIILDGTPAERRAEAVERHLVNTDEFWSPYPVPTVAMSEPSFDPAGEAMIWRGPVNMGTNWLLARGLRRHGFIAEADHIAERSRAAVAESGFREFYNPLTGAGMRGTNFGWGTAAVAM